MRLITKICKKMRQIASKCVKNRKMPFSQIFFSKLLYLFVSFCVKNFSVHKSTSWSSKEYLNNRRVRNQTWVHTSVAQYLNIKRVRNQTWMRTSDAQDPNNRRVQNQTWLRTSDAQYLNNRRMWNQTWMRTSDAQYLAISQYTPPLSQYSPPMKKNRKIEKNRKKTAHVG